MFLSYGGETLKPIKERLCLLCKADTERRQDEPVSLLELQFVAISSYHVYLYQAGAPALSIPAEVTSGLGHLPLLQPGLCGSLRCCEVSRAGPMQ